MQTSFWIQITGISAQESVNNKQNVRSSKSRIKLQEVQKMFGNATLGWGSSFSMKLWFFKVFSIICILTFGKKITWQYRIPAIWFYGANVFLPNEGFRAILKKASKSKMDYLFQRNKMKKKKIFLSKHWWPEIWEIISMPPQWPLLNFISHTKTDELFWVFFKRRNKVDVLMIKGSDRVRIPVEIVAFTRTLLGWNSV